MRDRGRGSRGWGTWLLAGICAAAIVVAVLLVGPAGSPTGAGERVVRAARGVVQASVSGTGSISAARQVDVDFATAGTLTHVFVHPGQRVAQGQLLAEIDSHDAQLQLDAAEADLAAAEETPVSSASGSTASAATASAAAPTATQPAPTPAPRTTPANDQGTSDSGSGSGQRSGGGSSGVSAAQRAASIATAQAAADRAEVAVADTRLTAPIGGTVAQVDAQAGEQVGGGGASGAASASSGSGGGSGACGSGGANGGSDGGSGNSSPGGSSGAAFIVLADLDALRLVVPFSESDVGKLRVGQPATVAVNALPGVELAAHAISIATLPTSNGGVVSYDVTFRLDQLAHGLKVGMTASAKVVVAQASDAVNVPSAAISRRTGGATVTLVRGGTRIQQPVVAGIAGDSTTQILSGLRAGDQVAIAVAPASGLGALAGGAGARFGGGGALGGFGGARRFGGGAGGGGVVIAPGGGGP